MGKEVYRRCSDCGTVNVNTNYCNQCGSLVNIQVKRELERRHVSDRKEADKSLQQPNAVTVFFRRALNHPNFLIKGFARLLYSIWIVVMMVGTFIAFLFSYVAA